jgi:DNA-binding PadR family transcriptional regulator
MLSYAGALLLGMVAERPANPYELKKVLEKIQVKKWLPVAGSTVYATMKTLCAKGYCKGTPEREGGMPEKTVYSVTEMGNQELNETLASYLGDTGLDTKKFHVAALMICHLDREEAVSILQNKLSKIQKIEAHLKATLDATKSIIPYTGICVIKHELAAMRAEAESATELLECAQNDSEWNTFMARDAWFS